MPKVKVEHEEKEIEVDLPEGTILPEQAKQYTHNAVVRKMIDEEKASWKEKVLDDPSFLQSFAAKYDIPIKDGKPAISNGKDLDLAALREAWQKEHLEPVKTSLSEARSELESMRGELFVSEVVSAGSKHRVKRHLLERPKSGAQPAFVRLLRDEFAFDPDHGYHALRQGKGFAVSADASEDRPWKTVEERIAELRKQDGWKDYFDEVGAADTGDFRTGKGGSSPGVVRISRADARDAAKYRAAKARAEKADAQLEIVDE